MHTVNEAIAYFKARGFPSGSRELDGKNAVWVAARESISHIDTHEIKLFHHIFLIYKLNEKWIIRNSNWQIDIEKEFDSLPYAIEALSSHLENWLETCGESMPFWPRESEA